MDDMDKIYIDSRGAEMEHMSFIEALNIVYDLAEGNQIDENDIAFGDDGLSAQRRWQDLALMTTRQMIDRQEDVISSWDQPGEAKDWPGDAVNADRSMDPLLPNEALRIVLDLGTQGALDPRDAISIELADEIDIQQQALDVVHDLLGAHGDKIRSFPGYTEEAPAP